MYTVNSHIKDVLADQVIDIVLLKIEANNYDISVMFSARIESVIIYVHSLFVDYVNNKFNTMQVEEKEVILMNKLIEYRNSYRVNSYGYRFFNSVYDVVKETFINIANK